MTSPLPQGIKILATQDLHGINKTELQPL